jgi:DHA3 family macrolide efflux protein-like MFS transporter
VDAISYIFAIGALIVVRFPAPPRDATKKAGQRSLKADLVEGWQFIRERRGLFGLMVFITTGGFVVSMVMLLINPLVLAFTDIDHLKWIASIAGMGALTGGIITSIWGGPQRRVLGIAGLSLLAALILPLAALPPSVPLIAVSAAIFVFTFPLTSACNQFIWQTKVPPELQGRVAALRRVVFQAMGLTVSLLGGVLADQVFEPLMAKDGALASSVGQLIGTGQGRGVALMFVMLSLLMLANVVVLWLSPRTRNVESELPDALPTQPRHPQVPTPMPADLAADVGTAPRLAATGSTET